MEKKRSPAHRVSVYMTDREFKEVVKTMPQGAKVSTYFKSLIITKIRRKKSW